MLYLISLGLADEKDMSLRAFEAAKKCDFLYAEFYTTKMFTDAERLSRLLGKPVKEIQRSGMEENSQKILEEAKTKNIGILVGGDALTATTHTSLLMDAKKTGIRTKIIHGSSILAAIAETGLQIYKFGKTTTLALPEKNYKPTSCYDVINQNRENGSHTLVLMDVKSEKGRYMDIPEALNILVRDDVLDEGSRIIAACCLGSDEQIIKYTDIKQLLNDDSLHNKTPAVLVIPGKLHFMEEDFLNMYYS